MEEHYFFPVLTVYILLLFDRQMIISEVAVNLGHISPCLERLHLLSVPLVQEKNAFPWWLYIFIKPRKYFHQFQKIINAVIMASVGD